MHREIGFWLAVGLVAIVALILFKVLAPHLPRPLQQLAAIA